MVSERILPKPRLVPKKVEKFCRCNAVFAVEKTRMLECQKCGRAISPFDYLMKFAERNNVVDMSVRMLLAEEKRLNSEIEDLKRKRKNLKAQVARIGKKLSQNKN